MARAADQEPETATGAHGPATPEPAEPQEPRQPQDPAQEEPAGQPAKKRRPAKRSQVSRTFIGIGTCVNQKSNHRCTLRFGRNHQ